jgi:hypothetical protein
MGEWGALAGLFASSFVSATILPGNSEIVLGAIVAAEPGMRWPAVAVATVGNTLGGMTSYGIGRLVPAKARARSRRARWRSRAGTVSDAPAVVGARRRRRAVRRLRLAAARLAARGARDRGGQARALRRRRRGCATIRA